jgi:type II secretory pathway predicted ATPase ExeA/septal ring-binding cell division protein DamX
METFDAGQSPFQESIDTQRFFPGSGRREVLDKLQSAIAEPVTLLTLTGEEGCGKTMICRMIEKELPEGYVPIFFSQTIDSFEDVTRAIAQKMNITLADGVAVDDIRALLLEVWERLMERKQRMLLIFDQAEQLYLATLERIRKMLDIVNQTGIAFQILFSGRNGLLENLKHIMLCNFQGATERHFCLERLDSSATYSYLNFCMNRGKSDGKEIFSPEMSEKIFMSAAGNIRITNTLAEESLRFFTADTSFMVLLDNVQDTLPKGHPEGWNFSFFKEKFLACKKWILPVGAGLGVLFLLLIMRMGGAPDVHESKQAPKGEKKSAELQNIQKQPEEIKMEAAKTDAEPPQRAEIEKPEANQIQTVPVPSPATTEGIVKKKPVVEKNAKATPIALTNTTLQTAQPKKPVQEKAPVSATKSLASPKEPLSEKKPALKTAPVPEKTTISKNPPVEKIFTGRVAASAKWLIGEKNDRFTLQLMVLGSEGADKNFKKMLAQKQYQDVADRLFILRRASSPPVVLVFYGEYSTMDDAKNARKTLPEFLLKKNPYAISVKGAVKKANGG